MGKKSHVQELRDQGFDESYYIGAQAWSVGCSQCLASTINGVACHETGCPNKPTKTGDDASSR